LGFLQAKNKKYLKSVHVKFTEKKLQYLGDLGFSQTMNAISFMFSAKIIDCLPLKK